VRDGRKPAISWKEFGFGWVNANRNYLRGFHVAEAANRVTDYFRIEKRCIP
jgi:hypothetical protein